MHEFMGGLAADLGVDSYALFGGTPLDTYLDPDAPLHDVDIALRATPGQLEALTSSLLRSGYEIVEWGRQYFINLTEEVLIVLARKNDLLLDVNVLDDLSLIGQFDLETLKCRYPQMEYEDGHDALGALERRTAKTVRDPAGENPYLLLTRLITLAAKYRLELAADALHQGYIDDLNARIGIWKYGNEFHDEKAPAGHCSSVLRSILRAGDRLAFVNDLTRSGALSETIPELHGLLSGAGADDSAPLLEATTKEDLGLAIIKLLPPEGRQQFARRLGGLRARLWEQSDLSLAERTSAYR
jgi:hypothetical protein